MNAPWLEQAPSSEVDFAPSLADRDNADSIDQAFASYLEERSEPLSNTPVVHVTTCGAGATIVYEQERRGGQHSGTSFLHLVASEVADHGLAKSTTPDSAHPVGESSRERMHRQLSRMLLSAAGEGDQRNERFVDYLALALRALAVGSVDRNARGGLASWQERKAKFLMSKQLDESVPMQQIATACGISVAHFARAFKQSTGLPPHRWLMERRLEHAKSLLLGSNIPLIDIANICGFAGQSHFTRIFTKRVGTSPGVWRRKLGRPAARPHATAMHEEARDRHGTHPVGLLADSGLSTRCSQRA